MKSTRIITLSLTAAGLTTYIVSYYLLVQPFSSTTTGTYRYFRPAYAFPARWSLEHNRLLRGFYEPMYYLDQKFIRPAYWAPARVFDPNAFPTNTRSPYSDLLPR